MDQRGLGGVCGRLLSRCCTFPCSKVWICYLILLCMFLLLFFLGYLLLKCLVVFGEKAPNVEHKYQCTGDPDHLLKPDPVTLTWHDLTYSVKDKKGKKEKKKKKKLCAKKDKDGDKDKDKDQDKKDPAPKEAKKGKKCFGKGDGPMKKLLNNVSGMTRRFEGDEGANAVVSTANPCPQL